MSNTPTPNEVVLCWALAHLLTHYIDEATPDNVNDAVEKRQVVVGALSALSKCGYKYPEDFA